MVEVFAGAALATLVIVIARKSCGERWLYSLGLLSLPGIYACFALHAGDPAAGARELISGMPYIVAALVFAFFSVRQSALTVGALWWLHGLYDLAHVQPDGTSGVPYWYPLFCMAVDAVVGSYLLWLSRRIPEGNLRSANRWR